MYSNLSSETKRIMSCVDHTLLSQTATQAQIKELCDDAMLYQTASVCIPPSYVQFAAEYLEGRLPVCTVIGFPNGYNTSEVKLAETADALKNGADEIDMVINISDAVQGNYEAVLNEIKRIKEICGAHILKVIVETYLLSDEQKIAMCNVVARSGADYIKTSTGFAGGGATAHDIELFAKHIGGDVKIKAAGGIKTFDDARLFLELGACRLGTSRLVALLKQQ